MNYCGPGGRGEIHYFVLQGDDLIRVYRDELAGAIAQSIVRWADKAKEDRSCST